MCAGVNERGQHVQKATRREAARAGGRYRRARRACAATLTCCREAVERYSFKLMRTPDTEIKAKFQLDYRNTSYILALPTKVFRDT